MLWNGPRVESALSPQRELALLRLLHDHVRAGSQFQTLYKGFGVHLGYSRVSASRFLWLL
jgi:hypothetical protein